MSSLQTSLVGRILVFVQRILAILVACYVSLILDSTKRLTFLTEMFGKRACKYYIKSITYLGNQDY